MTADDIKNLSVPDTFDKLSASAEGLTQGEAEKRIEDYGYNEIIEKKVSPVVKFLGFFWGPIPWMIEAAAILSVVIHHWEDFWVIIALLLLNAVVGFWQENKADNAIELLKQKLALKARVLRDGKWSEIPARELVPGDIVRVRLGDIIPADIKLTEGDYLQVDESALTGESLPVEKHTSDVAYSGSIVRRGEINGVVVATGMNSYFGKTAKLVEEVKTLSNLQKVLIKIGNYLIVLAIATVTLIFVVAMLRGESFLETLKFALVLIVAAIPVALPAVLSVSMAVGATTLAKKKAIVSKLASIEELSGVDILCTDKTGTITKNELVLAEVAPIGEFAEKDLLLYATLASREEDQDPIDNAIIVKTLQVLPETPSSIKTLDFKPFDPVTKRTEATVEGSDGTRFQVTKGAPQVILSLVAHKEALQATVENDVNEFASRGYRTLGVAKTDAHGNWQFVGLIPLYDPPRDDSAETIETAQSMGVNVKMVTGDHTAIAKEIGRQVHLGTNIVPADTLVDKSESEAERIVEEADGFAQVFPEHKYRIVELLQKKQHIVGMTGDGVNDAPALKKADTGIAVDGATDAAKSAADIVLTSPGLSVIIDAIKESRKIFQRMDSYAIYRIAETIRVLFFIALTIIIFDFYPITALMLVLLALLNDVPIMAIAYDNVRYSNMPERWNMRFVMRMATLLGVIGVIFSFMLFYIGEVILLLPPEIIQPFIFLKLAVAGHLTIFLTRTRGHFWTLKPGSALLWSAGGTKLLATLIVVYGLFVPAIGWNLALLVWGYAFAEFVITDFIKIPFFKKL
jgi:H+-transporting ATPase